MVHAFSKPHITEFLSRTVAQALSVLFAVLFAASIIACGSEGGNREPENFDTRDLSPEKYTVHNLYAKDDYEREVLPAKSEKQDKKYVGVFYFVHLGNHGSHNGIYDISKMTENNYDTFFNAAPDSKESPVGSVHYFAEPMYGYYSSDDDWVMRKHIEMLTMADIDFLALDTTNGELYKNSVEKLLSVIKEFMQQGWNVPKVMFYINSKAADKTREAYDTFYKSGKWDGCWFSPNGKPMIVSVTANNNGASDQSNQKPLTDKTLLNYFEVKESQWPNSGTVNPEGVPWIDFSYPQSIHKGTTGSWINVSIAQHSQTIRMSDQNANCGRGYRFVGDGFDSSHNDSAHFREGINFDYQWQTVFANASQIDYVFITGWNEWVAEKGNAGTMENPEYRMVDSFNEEYSRDIEPMNGGYADNFYLQMIQNIRKFKYDGYQDNDNYYDDPYLTVDVADFDGSTWDACVANYRDFAGECVERKPAGFPGAGMLTDKSNRNDIAAVKVAKDKEYLYFRIETKTNISEYESGDNGWMNVLIGTNNGGEYGPLGLQYVVNRSVSGNTTDILRYKTRTTTEKTGEGEIYVQKNIMQLKLPLVAFSFGDRQKFTFKVCDNIGSHFMQSNFYTKGDSAPIGRLTYFYGG